MSEAIVAALVAEAPAIIAEYAKPGSRCILATRIGAEALRYFQVEHTPMAVNFDLMNAACVVWVEAGQPGDVEAVKAAGVHLISIHETVEGPGWSGHLVLALPEIGGFVDLDLQQFKRPAKAIDLPDAASFETRGHQPPWPFTVNGCVLRYTPRWMDLSYRTAPDWRRDPPREACGRLIRAMVLRLKQQAEEAGR